MVRPLAVGGVLLLPIVVDASQVWIWRIVQRLEIAREVAAEVATTRERVRIAAELHDVQGYSLHVIAMQAELVERLLPVHPAAAQKHARTVRTLASDALRETRSLVYGYRESNVAAEVHNAAAMLRAAGAKAVVRGEPAVIPPSAAPVFASLVREATTNMLRHSTPSHVEIFVECDSRTLRLTLTNDGVVDAPGTGLPGVGGTGLAGLRERFEQQGGTLVIDSSEPDIWSVTGTLPVTPARQE